jgi:aspartate-semialdehyde dehydrogenase
VKKYNVAVIGVGAVGIEMIRVLRQRDFPVNKLVVMARSSRAMNVDGLGYDVIETTPEAFKGIQIALFAGTEGEKGAAVTFAKSAVEQGAIVIDNGADFRMEPDVPLVVPEVNPDDIKLHHGIIANPNCSTIQMVVALNPIHRVAGIKKVVVTTFQAASGAGGKAVEDLRKQSEGFLLKKEVSSSGSFAHPLAFNVIPQIGSFADLDYTTEEWKLVKETRKIMHKPDLLVNSTTVRVPVFNVHSESVYFETESPITVEQIKRVFLREDGIVLLDDPNMSVYPMPINVQGKDPVYIGRIRRDPDIHNGFVMWVVADNLRKGAATNAIQIAERLG